MDCFHFPVHLQYQMLDAVEKKKQMLFLVVLTGLSYVTKTQGGGGMVPIYLMLRSWTQLGINVYSFSYYVFRRIQRSWRRLKWRTKRWEFKFGLATAIYFVTFLWRIHFAVNNWPALPAEMQQASTPFQILAIGKASHEELLPVLLLLKAQESHQKQNDTALILYMPKNEGWRRNWVDLAEVKEF